MAGHNKWSKVKRQKGVTDAKKAKVFAKLAREIGIAVRVGGPEADLNPRLRMILLKCRSANMPADNIDRAIKKAAGEGKQQENSRQSKQASKHASKQAASTRQIVIK